MHNKIPMAKVLCLALLTSLLSLASFAEERILNMKDADIRALIAQVADVTGYNFIIDPRIKGNVTVISSTAMDADAIYQLFLSILKVHGFSAVKTGNVVKVIPEARAKQDNIPISGDGATTAFGDEMVTRVLQVQNTTASQLIPILRPLVPQYGHLAAYPPTNVIIISDRASNIERLVNVIRRIDRASTEEVEIIPVTHASAADIARLIQNLEKQNVSGEKTATAQRVMADERTNSLLLSGDQHNRTRLRALIAQLDREIAASGNTTVVYLKYAVATDLVAILDGVSGSITDEEGSKNPNSSEGVTIQADEATNAVIITAPPDVQRSLLNIISQLDIRRAQVLVEAIIVEMNLDKARALGIQWAVKAGNLLGGTTANNVGRKVGDVIDDILAIENKAEGASFSRALGGAPLLTVGRFREDGLSFAALLNALSNDIHNNILSTPSLMTLDNTEAKILVGQEVPFRTGERSNTGNSDDSDVFTTIKREEIGITLKVTPHINEGGAITLEIEQEVSDISQQLTEDFEGVASDLITNKRNITTTVLVDDGETIVLGGLISNTAEESVERVPLLGDLPIIGHFFKSRSTKRNRRNLMIFLRPAVMRDPETQREATLNKYNFMRDAQQVHQDRGLLMFPKSETVPVLPEWGQPLSLPPSYEDLYGTSPLPR